MSIQWAQVAKALQDWIVAESGLSDATVLWSEREGGRPAGRYIAMRVTNIQQIGHDWLTYEDATSPTPGAELQSTRQGFREVLLTLQCFAAKNDAVITAIATLDKAIGGHRKYKGDLKAVGIAVLSTERIQSIDGRIGLSYEARAIGTVRMSLASNVVGFETYIQSFELSGNVSDGDDTEEIPAQIFGEFPTELAAPTSLAAEAGDEQITLTWAADDTAESFNLYFSESSPVDVDTATQITGVTSPYVHTGRTNDTEYFYAVTAVNVRFEDESALSNETSATPTEPTEP